MGNNLIAIFDFDGCSEFKWTELFFRNEQFLMEMFIR